jgi:hypothetical protein
VGGAKREITAFDFQATRHQSGSPELGIREVCQCGLNLFLYVPIHEFFYLANSRNQRSDDDDEFGDFTEARGNNSATSKPTAVNPVSISVNIPALKAAPKAQTAAMHRVIVV